MPTIQLSCILDLCPKDHNFVDYRKCVKCKFFKGQKVIGTVLCNHQKAKHNPNKERWQTLKKASGMLHLLLVN